MGHRAASAGPVTGLRAPLAGWMLPLCEVPDPVFASGSMGDGFAIDPLEGLVSSPCAGTISAIAPTLHSLTINVEGGGTLLIHVGLETVALKGVGFQGLVQVGQRVATGDPLIAFDLNMVALGAKSLITPIVAIGDGDALTPGIIGRRVARGEKVGEVRGRSAEATPVIGAVASATVILPMAHGIHARPAAGIVTAAKSYTAALEIRIDDRRADARSIVQLLSLAAKQGDEITVTGTGNDAAAAVRRLADLIATGMGDLSTTAAPSAAPRPDGPVVAAPGLAIGIAAQLTRTAIDVPEGGCGPEAESAALAAALATVDRRLAQVRGAAAEIATAHRALLNDPALQATAEALIDGGKSAAFAWRVGISEVSMVLKRTGDALLAERIADLSDLEQQVIAELTGAEVGNTYLPSDAILIADDLLPSEFQSLDLERLTGVILARGGPTSHVAVLASSAGVPMLVAAGTTVLDIAAGTPLILDAETATLTVSPDAKTLAATGARVAAMRAAKAVARASSGEDARTRDGVRIEVFANLGSLEDAGRAVSEGAEGCGLLRTEFLFLERQNAPGEDEQAEIYRSIAATLGDRPLIVRTFDIGGDKPVTYLPMPPEENPALGCRGVRLNLARSDLLDTQLRAIVRGVPAGQRRIMLPMVVEKAELDEVRHRLREIETELQVTEPTSLGVMIETPAAALLSSSLAEAADFFSIGSNDLTQYALACDRGNSALAAKLDALHPAVLKLIALAAEGAQAGGRWLGVCGSLGSDPAATAILIGLGVTELSVAPGQIALIKAVVRRLDIPTCRSLAQRALACADAGEVRTLVKEAA